MKRFIKILMLSAIVLASLAVCLIAFLAFVLMHHPDPNKSDRAFISSVKRALQQQGQTARVEDIHSGDWSKVCILSDYSLPQKAIIYRLFGLRPGEVKYSNRKPLATDSEWSVLFFHPPNTLESFMIPNRYMMAAFKAPCQERQHAVFEFASHSGWEWPTIILTTHDLVKGNTRD